MNQFTKIHNPTTPFHQAPLELKNTLNLTLARGSYFFIGPKVNKNIYVCFFGESGLS
jgi:hypothetical protein